MDHENDRGDAVRSTDKPVNPNLSLSWRLIAVVAVLVSIAAIGALVLVATSQDADALSTIALALAILAFVIQIMVFIAQVFAANQQATRSEEIYTRMHGLLEGLRGTTQGTQETLNTYIGRLIQAATNTVSETVEESTDATFDTDEFQRRLLEEVKTVTRENRALSDHQRSMLENLTNLQTEVQFLPGSRAVAANESPDPVDQLIIEQLRTFPDETEGEYAYKKLRELSPIAQQELRKFGESEMLRRRSGRAVGLTVEVENPFVDELVRMGLLEQINTISSRKRRMRLTETGRSVARLLTAKDDPPDWLVRLSKDLGA